MSSWLVFLLSVVAIAIGWLLGKFPLQTYWRRYRNRGWQQPYLQVVRILMHEQSDKAIESFVESWPVTPNNMELHNALANMLRKKGEADRAIRIRLSLLECNKLSKSQVQQATIELAHDYLAAGLLDRAERLLINVANNTEHDDERVLELLQRIYQTEKDWHKAIAVAEQLLPKYSIKFASDAVISGRQAIEIAHYYCEIATAALKEQRFSNVEKCVEQALAVHPECARASMLQAEMAIAKGDSDLALQALARVEWQDCRLLPECLPLIRACFDKDEQGFADYLIRLQQSYPSSTIELAIFESLKTLKADNAETLFLQYVERRPSLQSVRQLAKLQLSAANGQQQQHVALLYQLVDQVIKTKATFQCRECGFSGMQLHWLCPQCHSWDSIRRRRGSEGD